MGMADGIRRHGGGRAGRDVPATVLIKMMMTTNNTMVHVYQFRQVFVGDEHVGKYDGVTKSIRMRVEHAGDGDKVAAFFRRRHGIFAKVVVGDEALAAVAPLMEFPDEVKGLMSAELGDRTPVVMEWARANFPELEYERRYGKEHESGGMSHEWEVPEVDDEEDEVPEILTEGGADFPQGEATAEDEDWADEAGKLVADLPVAEVPCYTLEGTKVFREGVEVAGIYQDGKQLRMRAGFSLLRAEVELFLEECLPQRR